MYIKKYQDQNIDHVSISHVERVQKEYLSNKYFLLITQQKKMLKTYARTIQLHILRV